MDEAPKPRKRLQMYADEFNSISVAIDLYEDTTPEQVEQALIWLAGEIHKYHIDPGHLDWQEELAKLPVVIV
jgi:hypothetical protein